MLEDLDVELTSDVEDALRVVGKLHILVEFLMLVLWRSHILFFDVEHQAFGLVLADPVELLAVDQRRDPGRANDDVYVIGVDGLAVLFVALRADRLMGQLGHMPLQHLASDLHLDQYHEKGRHEGISQLKDIEVKHGVEHIGEVTVALEFSEDLVGADLEELVEIAEEALEVVVEVVAGVHEHGVEDESVEEDEHLQEDGHDEGEGEAQILVEVVHLVVLLSLWELEDGQDLQEGADGGVLGAEEDDYTHQLQEEVPVSVLGLDGQAVLNLAAEEAVALALVLKQDSLVDVYHEQERSNHLLGQPQSIQLPRLRFPQLVVSVQFCLDHEQTVKFVLSSECVVLDEFVIAKVDGQLENIALQQPVLESVGLKVIEVGEGFLNGVKGCGIKLIPPVLHFEADDWFLVAAEHHQPIFLQTLRHVEHFGEVLLDFCQSSELHFALVDVEALLVKTQVVLAEEVEVEVGPQVAVVLVDLLIGGADDGHRCDDEQANEYELRRVVDAVAVEDLLVRGLRQLLFL